MGTLMEFAPRFWTSLQSVSVQARGAKVLISIGAISRMPMPPSIEFERSSECTGMETQLGNVHIGAKQYGDPKYHVGGG